MKASLRVLGRISFLLCVLVLLILGFFLAWFASWRADRLALLDSGSELAETDRGPMEFMARGDGPAVLVFHGTPGGYDQAMLLGSTFAAGGFQIIAPSRPGYLRTPLSTGLTPELQADAVAALVDKLNLPRVAILASSWGAPAGVEFAIRHPEKVWALVLVAPLVTKFDSSAELERSEPARLLLDGLRADFGAWMLVQAADRDPRRALSLVLDAVSDGPAAQRDLLLVHGLEDPDQIEWFRTLVGTFAPLSVRDPGLRNDLGQIRALRDLAFEKITAPTLIVHGTADRFLPSAVAETVARRIPGAVLLPVEGAGHLVAIGPSASDVREKVAEFLEKHAPAP